MPKRLLAVIWFPVAILLLGVNLTILAGYDSHTQVQAAIEEPVAYQPAQDPTLIYTDNTEDVSQVLGASVIADDARPLLIREFLEKHASPMAPFADVIVQEADRYGIDFRLVVSIAMCESNLGKKMPKDSHNAWGIAVYTGQNSGANFNDWPHALEWVSRYMKEHYYDIGLVDLKDIGAKYAPPSVDKGYSWTRCVEKFQNEIR